MRARLAWQASTETPHPHEVEPGIAARSIVLADELADQEKREQCAEPAP